MKAKLVLCCILKIASSGKFSQNASYHSKSFKELKSELSRIPDQSFTYRNSHRDVP